MKARFYVGEEEKHEIYVTYSNLSGKLNIDIDGKRVTDTYDIFFTKTFNFKIGEKEVHEVMIKISGVFMAHAELYVDSKLVGRALN